MVLCVVMCYLFIHYIPVAHTNMIYDKIYSLRHAIFIPECYIHIP